jgi:hypothetical protein
MDCWFQDNSISLYIACPYLYFPFANLNNIQRNIIYSKKNISRVLTWIIFINASSALNCVSKSFQGAPKLVRMSIDRYRSILLQLWSLCLPVGVYSSSALFIRSNLLFCRYKLVSVLFSAFYKRRAVRCPQRRSNCLLIPIW